MIHFDCPRCAFALDVPAHRAGSVLRCPECEELLRVPAPAELGPPAPTEPVPEPEPEPELIQPIATPVSGLGTGAAVLLAAVPIAVVVTALTFGGVFARSHGEIISTDLPEPAATAPSQLTPSVTADTDATAAETSP